MIAQNDALDEHKKLCYRKFVWPTEKNGPWGPKMAIFGQKHQVLAKNDNFFGSKIFNFFALSDAFRPACHFDV